MVYPQNRSMNHDLEQGMEDGRYKQICPNRGGVVEKELHARRRADLYDNWYGIREKLEKQLPDSTVDKHSSTWVECDPQGDGDGAQSGNFIDGSGKFGGVNYGSA